MNRLNMINLLNEPQKVTDASSAKRPFVERKLKKSKKNTVTKKYNNINVRTFNNHRLMKTSNFKFHFVNEAVALDERRPPRRRVTN